MDYPEAELLLEGVRVPIVSFFEDQPEDEVRKLPEPLGRLIPLVERTCFGVDLDRELPEETTALLWKLLNERSQTLRDVGKVAQTIATATTQRELLEIIVECLHDGLTPKVGHSTRFLSFQNLRRVLQPRLRSRARRLLTGAAVAGFCGDYAGLFHVLFFVVKRRLGLDDLAVASITGRLGPSLHHGWNWVVSTHDGWIAPFDVHSAARAEAAPSVGSIWNTGIEAAGLPHVSAFASMLMVYFDGLPHLAGRAEIVEFFDVLFASAGERRRALVYQIARHGLLRPEVEKRLIDRWPLAAGEQRAVPAGGPYRALRPLLSADTQLRLLARAFDG